jgi:flagellar FliJ protein
VRRFRFSLEAVLRLKKQLEELRQRELAAAQAERDLTLQSLGGFENGLRNVVEEQAQSRKQGVTIAAETWFQARHYGLSLQIRGAKKALFEKEQLLDAARNKAVEAARESKVLEKLEERQRLEHQQQSLREEQGFMDEMAQHAASVMAYPSPSATA